MPFDPKTAPPIDFMRYKERTQDAMREVMRETFVAIARDGLIGDHHLHVTFDTRARGVALSAALREKYPDEMNVILQHQFAELTVDDKQFSVVLWFAKAPERIVVPFAAVTGFHDPSVSYGLKFERLANVNRPHGPASEPAAPELTCDFCGAPGEPPRKIALGRNACICQDCAERIAAELRPPAGEAGDAATEPAPG